MHDQNRVKGYRPKGMINGQYSRGGSVAKQAAEKHKLGRRPSFGPLGVDGADAGWGILPQSSPRGGSP